MGSRLLKVGQTRMIPGVGRSTSLLVDWAKGSYVHDSITDKMYLDLTSGIAVTSTGHCHPKIVKAIQDQAGRLIHGQANIFLHEPVTKLIEKLGTIMPSKVLDKFFLANSGSEAVENAVKLARAYTGKQNIIVFQGGFHGRTFGAMALTTSKAIYKHNFSPLMPGVLVAPFPYPSQIFGKGYEHLNRGSSSDEAVEFSCRQLELLFDQQFSPNSIAAMLIEPVLGEGGFVPAHPCFLAKMRELCTKHNILLIIDEVQSGVARTGSMFAIEAITKDVAPDILVIAKGIASGMPLSIVATTEEISSTQPPGSMGGTYGGNPIACAAAAATIDVIHDEDILGNVSARSRYMISELNSRLPKILERHRIKADVRGLGLMIGIEFFTKDNRKLNLASKIAHYSYQHLNLLLMTTSAFDTIRLMPPLTLTQEDAKLAIDKLLNAVENSLKEL